jgi:hypothetical protein
MSLGEFTVLVVEEEFSDLALDRIRVLVSFDGVEVFYKGSGSLSRFK